MDRASLLRAWSGALKYSAIGTSVSGVLLLMDGSQETKSVGLLNLLGAALGLGIAVGLDSLAKSQLQKAMEAEFDAQPSGPFYGEQPEMQGAKQDIGRSSTAERVSPVQERVWYLLAEGRPYGPYTFDDLAQLVAEKQMVPKSLLRRSSGSWIQAGKIAELAFLFREPQARGSSDLPNPGLSQPPLALPEAP